MECGHLNAIVPRKVEALNLEEPIKEELMPTINPDLPPENKEKLQQALITHSDCFAASSKDLGECHILTHEINTEKAKPIHQLPNPTAFKQKNIIQREGE